MIGLSLGLASTRVRNILCIGSHCDDIEIGCGGSIITILESAPDIDVTWVVFCSNEARAQESRVAACSILAKAKASALHFLEFDDGYLPYHGADAKRALENIASSVSPDLIFTHYRNDAHQDHRLISELTWNTFRDHLILEYEIPKYDGDLSAPSVFIPLTDDIVEQKISIILSSFLSQSTKHWFTDETFRSLPRLRGIESGRENRYAEAFYCRKIIVTG